MTPRQDQDDTEIWLRWDWDETEMRLRWDWDETEMRLRWDWDETEMRLRWDWDETEMRLRWDWGDPQFLEMSIISCRIVSIELKKKFNFKMQRKPIAFLFFSLETKRISYI
jgi:hypothetical protein